MAKEPTTQELRDAVKDLAGGLAELSVAIGGFAKETTKWETLGSIKRLIEAARSMQYKAEDVTKELEKAG